MSLSELLAEAITDQENHVPQNRLRLYDRLMIFRQYLIDNHIGNTVSSTLSKIKTFYKYNRVAVPFIPPINIKNIRRHPCVSYGDLLTKSEIKKALSIADDNLAMWIYVMMSSGSSRLEAKMLTNETFYMGTYEYHQKDNPRFLKLSYIKCMSNVSLYHRYSYEIVDGEVMVYSQKL